MSHNHQGLPPEEEAEDHALSDPIAKGVETNLHGGLYYKIDATAAADSGEPVAIADTEEDPSGVALSDSPDDENQSTDLASPHDLDEVFASLYPDLPEEDGLKASRNQRLSKGYDSITLTYGEVSVRGFAEILSKVRDKHHGLPLKGGTFYDLGCGTGKPVFVAAACHTWEHCVGFEILSDLHTICANALERWHGGMKDAVTVGGTRGGTAEIEFVCGDFTVLDWSDGDVVFANSTCFDEELMGTLAQSAAALKEGAILVTQTDPVPSPAFEILEETEMMQAGRAATTCFIQRRLPKPPPAFGPV